MSYLGLDVGTTGCKAVIFDVDGVQRAASYREYAVRSPRSGWAELDSQEVCERCFDVIRESASACVDDRVRGISISSQGEAFTPVGQDGSVAGNAMVSSDARAAAIAEKWSEEFGRELLYRKTGHTAHPMFTLFKLIWLRENQPDVWRGAKSFYCFEELIQHRLGLDPAISWCLAGRTMLFNVQEHDWDEDILAAIGLHRSRLARTLVSGSVVGTIPSQIARSLGLPDDVVVVTGGHDQCCGALGAGIASPGKAAYGMGTVDCITPAFASPVFSENLMKSNLATYDFTLGGMYTTVAFNLTGGNILKWFRDEWSQAEAKEAAETGQDLYGLITACMPTKPSELLVLPYFAPSGTPYFDAHARGAILGLRLSTRRPEVLRALLEGVAFEMRLNLEILDSSGIEVNALVAIGGGARNRAVVQLKADVLGIPITIASVTEAGCMGAAMLAKAADTGEDVRHIAQRWVRLADVCRPDPVNAEIYGERFETYKRLYPALRSLM